MNSAPEPLDAFRRLRDDLREIADQYPDMVSGSALCEGGIDEMAEELSEALESGLGDGEAAPCSPLRYPPLEGPGTNLEAGKECREETHSRLGTTRRTSR